MSQPSDLTWHGTTILCLRKDGKVVIAGDGQVSFGQTVLKSNAKKLRRLGNGGVLAGLPGATADAPTLFARLEANFEPHPRQLSRARLAPSHDRRTPRSLPPLAALTSSTAQSRT